MRVTVKAAEGRRVWVGEGPLSGETWQTVELTGDLVKAIKNGDVIEGTPVEPDAPNIKESLDAAKQRADEAAAERARAAEEAAAGGQPQLSPGDAQTTGDEAAVPS